MIAPLPFFSRPPLWEVVISAQFSPLTEMHVAHLGRIWEVFRHEYPGTDEQLPLDSTLEVFENKDEPPTGAPFEVISALPFPRAWFLSADGTELIQLQQDRFIRNWRKVSGSEEYPRYRHLADLFFAEFQKFIAIVEDEHLGIMVPLQYELTYINHIGRGQIENPGANLGQILSVVLEDILKPVGLEVEDSRFSARYAIRDDSSRQIGRLYVAADPARRVSDGEVISRLTLTAKLSPRGPSFEDMRNSLDLAHLAIVRSFAALTTQRMHEAWGRSDVR